MLIFEMYFYNLTCCFIFNIKNKNQLLEPKTTQLFLENNIWNIIFLIFGLFLVLVIL